MSPLSERSSMMTSANVGDGNGLETSSVASSYRGTVTFTEPSVPSDFSPSLAPTVDPEMFLDANGRKKRVWILTIPPETSASELEGAKLKKTKCTTVNGLQFRVASRMKKDHVAVVMNRDLQSVAIRTRIAGSVTLNRHIDVPGLCFDPTSQKLFAPTKDARQRYVPFGAATPSVHSTPPEDSDSPPKKRKKKLKKKKDF